VPYAIFLVATTPLGDVDVSVIRSEPPETTLMLTGIAKTPAPFAVVSYEFVPVATPTIPPSTLAVDVTTA